MWELADVTGNESGSFPEAEVELPEEEAKEDDDDDGEPDTSKAQEAAKPPWFRSNDEHGDPLDPTLETNDVRRRQKLLSAFYTWEHRKDFGGPVYNMVSLYKVAHWLCPYPICPIPA